MGLPVLQAPGEAERLCAQLALSGLAKAAATEVALRIGSLGMVSIGFEWFPLQPLRLNKTNL